MRAKCLIWINYLLLLLLLVSVKVIFPFSTRQRQTHCVKWNEIKRRRFHSNVLSADSIFLPSLIFYISSFGVHHPVHPFALASRQPNAQKLNFLSDFSVWFCWRDKFRIAIACKWNWNVHTHFSLKQKQSFYIIFFSSVGFGFWFLLL